jgi:hypothetical protein
VNPYRKITVEAQLGRAPVLPDQIRRDHPLGDGGGLRFKFIPPGGARIERTFAWISHNRRMSKDYERLAATSEAFIYVAMTRLMVRRLARAR